ncbi:MAG: hypothetical protein ACI9FD_003326 [Gammaproteobacteria bacterium]|jgi:hypothetical protein
MMVRQTNIEARKGKPGHRAMQQSKRFMWAPDTGQAVDRRMPAGCLIRQSTQVMGKP